MVSDLTLVSTRIFPGEGEPFPGFIQVRGGKILALGPTVPESPGTIVDVGDSFVVPGLIDLHVHGSGGFSATGELPELEGMARFLASNGVTAFQPTVGAAPVYVLERAIRAVKEFTKVARSGDRRPRLDGPAARGSAVAGANGIAGANEFAGANGAVGARSLGLHMEGPFLSRGRPGAMPLESLLDPDLSLMSKWISLGEGTIHHLTVAPEMPGALDMIRYLAGSGITVSMGHTLATYEQAIEGFKAGITVSNHTFNAMREFHHREPGALGAALTQKGVFCELIADGIHVHPAAMALLVASQGSDAVCLISDAVPAAGLSAGEYEFLGQRVTVDRQGRVTLPNGTIAGSAALLRNCLRIMVELVDVPFVDALRMATVNPAKAARVFDRKGSLAPGKDADIVVLAPDYEVLWCFVEGEAVKVPKEEGR